MKLTRLLAAASLALLAPALAGCLIEPTYSSVPEISFNNTDLQITDNNANAHLVLTINYQDGDGDLGLTNTEATSPPYANTRFTNNFFVEPYVQSTPGVGAYVPLSSARPGIVGTYDQTFVHATAAADGHSLPIKGTLSVTFDFFRFTTFPVSGETVQFHVSIADRAMHESNVIIIPVKFP